MKGQKQQNKSRVVHVHSKESWDFHVNKATSRGCPVVAHFTTIWCVPSVAMKPVFEEMATTLQDIVFITVDVDEVQDVAKRFEVKAMPTFLLIKKGVPVDKLVGANPQEVRKRVKNLV